jgi:hypothetical protein
MDRPVERLDDQRVSETPERVAGVSVRGGRKAEEKRLKATSATIRRPFANSTPSPTSCDAPR